VGGEESDRSPVIYTLARTQRATHVRERERARGDALGPFHTDSQRRIDNAHIVQMAKHHQ